MGVARGRCDRFAGQGIACGPGRCDPDGCGEGIADLSDRLGPDAVHPGEISLGHLRDCSRVTYPAAASACRAGLARPEGGPGPGGACWPVTR